MRIKSLVVGVLLAGFLFSTNNHTYANSQFTDVGEGHWAKNEIKYIAAGQIVNGLEDNRFYPEKNVTRAEAATMIGRSLAFDGTKRPTTLPDVEMNHYASGYIQEAVSRKIITGYPDGTFQPDRNLTRGEMAVLMSRAYGYGADTIPLAVDALMAKGISNGVGDGTFGINQKILRSELSVFLARAINPIYIHNYQAQVIDKAEVSSVELNVREGPLVSYPSVAKLSQGTSVEVEHIFGKWVFVKADNIEGYVNTNYLTGLDLPVPTPPPAKPPLEELLEQEMIVIDAGHGGKDPGAIGYGLNEKTVLLDVARKVHSLFANTGFSSALTRNEDVFMELSQRVEKAKNLNGDLFVSIHANSFNGTANGTETYYYAVATNPYESQSKKLATFIQKRMIEAWKLKDRGVKIGNYKVLRDNNMPASLVELGFIDNKTDAEKLGSEAYRLKAAKAIYLGILDYYQSEKKYDLSHLYDKGVY